MTASASDPRAVSGVPTTPDGTQLPHRGPEAVHPKICTYAGCEQPHYARALCSGHHRQLLRGQELRPLYAHEHIRLEGAAFARWLLDQLVRSPAPDGCWLWPGLSADASGRPLVTHRGTRLSVARLILRDATGRDPSRAEVVAHKCGDTRCCRPDHLEWRTVRSIRLAAIHAGRHRKCKLTADDVRAIRRRLAEGELQRVIAADYAVGPMTISNIATRRQWGHVD